MIKLLFGIFRTPRLESRVILKPQCLQYFRFGSKQSFDLKVKRGSGYGCQTLRCSLAKFQNGVTPSMVHRICEFYSLKEHIKNLSTLYIDIAISKKYFKRKRVSILIYHQCEVYRFDLFLMSLYQLDPGHLLK